MEEIVVLLVEDNPGDARLLEIAITKAETAKIDLRKAVSLAEAFACLSSEPVDLVILDLSLPDSAGYETFQAVKEQAPDCPIVILSGIYNETLAMEVIKNGAQDFIVKGEYDNAGIIRAVRYAIERKRMEISLRESEEQLAEAHDLLQLGQWSKNLSTGELNWSDGSYKVFGLKPGEIEPKEFWKKIIHPDDKSVIDEQSRRVSEGEKEFTTNYRIIHSSGEIRHVESRIKVHFDEQGNPSTLLGTNQDVTEREQGKVAID